MASLHIPVHSYQLRSEPATTARVVNCYAEQLPPGAKARALLRRTPGDGLWMTLGDGPITAMYTAEVAYNGVSTDYLYVVSGREVYYVDSDKNPTLIGTITTPVNVDIASNTNSLVVVNEPRAWSYDGTDFVEITDADFTSRGAGDVEFLDDFLLFREPNSGRFFGADIGSSTDFDALQFAIADSSPDLLVKIINDHRQLIAFGTKTTEIFENTGVAGFPFERNINGTIEKGCLNGKTVTKQDGAVYFVADDYTVRQLQGLAPVKISTHAVEQWLQGATASSLRAFSYDQDGHFFYVVTATEGTWVYDVVTNEWHERESYGETGWGFCSHAQFAGLELVGSRDSNRIGYLDHTIHTDRGATQRMEWTYQPVYAEGRRAFHDRFELIMQTGVGIATGQGSDPKIMLEYSDDGGIGWKQLPDKSLGKAGKTLSRVVWHNLGSSRERVYRCAVSDPVPVTITDTVLEARGGRL